MRSITSLHVHGEVANGFRRKEGSRRKVASQTLRSWIFVVVRIAVAGIIFIPISTILTTLMTVTIIIVVLMLLHQQIDIIQRCACVHHSFG